MLEESPGTRVDTVLGKLGKALEQGDIDATVNLFQADCYASPSPGISRRWRGRIRSATC